MARPMAQVLELDTFPASFHALTVQQAPRNIIFIGETGSGKSSVINLIVGRNDAAVSPDARPCTCDFASYDVSIEGKTYRLWDTPGLNEATGLGRLFKRSATSTVKGFLRERYHRKELDLLVFCVRGGRACGGMSRAYDVFCRATRRIGISVVIVVTRLEKEQPTMEAWWQNNERRLGDLGLVFDGHACLTCLSPHHRERASKQDICFLISTECRPRASSSLDQGYLNDRCVVC